MEWVRCRHRDDHRAEQRKVKRVDLLVRKMVMKAIFGTTLLVVSLLAARVPAVAQQPQHSLPWFNTSLSPDERANLLLHEMTQAEKIQMVHGIGWGPLRPGSPVPLGNNGGAGEVVGIPRLGIPDLNQADSAVGIRMAAEQSRYATLLPSVLGAAASWDNDAAYLYGDVIGRELRAQGYNESIGGGVDLARDPRNGRLFEYPGEDPVLAGYTVGNLIRGVQANHVMGDIKHYAFNDQETGRTIVDVHIDRKAARESDLLAFELGIRIGHPASVMCSYNKLNGDWACENDWLLNHILKHDWNFPGFVLSDWEGTHSTVKAAMAGLDMEQPSSDFFGPALAQAVSSGSVPQARLDDMVHRILRGMFATGVIDHPATPRKVVDPFRGREDAQKIAEESIVLLKNVDGVLPLNPAPLHAIAIIGAHADVGVMSGGGSAQVDAPGGNTIRPNTPTQWGEPVYFPSSPMRYIREHAPNADVRFDAGVDLVSAATLAKNSDVAIVFADQYMSEGADSLTLSLPNNQDALIQAVTAANPHTVVVLVTGNPVSMPWADQASAILEAWYPGIGGGQAIANILFGSVNPSGKLPITFAKNEADLPHPQIFGIDASAGQAGLPEHWSAERQKTSFPANFTEGARVGYKWFDSEDKQPLFPFGFGLSYTTFRYSGLHADTASKSVTFTLENTGQRAGTEIAEVYVQLPHSSGENFRRLAGWQRVALAPGEQRSIHIELESLALASFDEAAEKWQWLPGDYVVSVGGSSRDLHLQGGMTMR
jgi:beta-glucosidase